MHRTGSHFRVERKVLVDDLFPVDKRYRYVTGRYR
jgi:hypothetical protein